MSSVLKKTACPVVQMMVREDLKPYELSLLCVVAAYDECSLTTRQLAGMCHMSVGQVHITRQRLLDAGLIHGYKDRRPDQTGPPSWKLQAQHRCPRR